MNRSVLGVVAALLLCSCVAPTPTTDPVASAEPVTIAARSQERTTRDFTVRIRNRGCPSGGVGVGSGFVLDEHRIVTNHHVIDGADELEVTTWDGHDRTVKVVSAATLSDLAIVEVSGELPAPVERGEDPELGDHVSAVGYPGGNEFRVTTGEVIGYDSHTDPDESGDVIAVDATVRPGNSGGPLLDADGLLVGVVYAVRIADSAGLAIPVSRLEKALRRTSFGAVPPCSDTYRTVDEIAADSGVGSGGVPDAPRATTTTTYPCPSGTASASVTSIRSTPQPTYFEGDVPSYDSFVEGVVANNASAAIDVAYVEVSFAYPDGSSDSRLFFVDGSIGPGQTGTFADSMYSYGNGEPRATSATVEWYWTDVSHAVNCF